MFVAYRVAANEEFDVFGLNVDNWGASLTWNFGSGFPYTPFNFARGLQDFYLKNAGDGPYTSEVNLSFYKGFVILDKLNMVLTMDVTNLFNRKNVDLNGGGFNSLTGRVTAYGDYDPGNTPRNIYSWGGYSGRTSFSALVPPFAFRSPRQISFGMKVNWN
jgi:hypothetical protein